MPLIINMPDDMAELLKAEAERSGSTPYDVAMQAFEYYYSTVPPDLQEELDQWELASAEDLQRLEDEL